MDVREIEKKASTATKWSSLAEIAAKLVTPIVNMILARLLTPEAFGVVATVTMVTSFAEVFTDAGFQKYLIQHDFDSEEDLDQNTNVAFWTNLAISVLLFLIICIFNNQIASLVGNDGLGIVIVVSSITILITSFSSIQSARYKRNFDFKTLFFVRVITSLIPLVVTVPLAFIFRSYWALIIGTLLNNVVTAIILTIKSKWKPRFFYNIQQFKKMFSYSWWILLESIAVWLTSYIGTFIVGIYLSNYYLGLYKTSMSTVNQIIALITASTSMPLFSALSRLKNNKEAMINTYCNFIRAVSVLVIPMGVGIWLYRDLITQILLGSQWGEATNFVGLWGLMSSICLVLGTYSNGLFNAIGKTKLSFFGQLLHLVVLVPVLLCTAKIDFTTLYISRSFVRLEMVVVVLIFMKIFIKFPLLKLFKTLISPIICTLIMCAVNYPFSMLSDSIVCDILGIILCIIVYFVSMLIINKKVLISMFETFGINPSSIKNKLNQKKKNLY